MMQYVGTGYGGSERTTALMIHELAAGKLVNFNCPVPFFLSVKPVVKTCKVSKANEVMPRFRRQIFSLFILA